MFDSGISPQLLSKMNIVEFKDFTDDVEESESSYHGTFMTSLIGSQNPDCIGIAPESDIYVLKVFNRN